MEFKSMERTFLPVSKEDMRQRGIKQLDFVYVIGDAYVDHPSFGPAIISRVLQSRGYEVGIISQPDWKDPDSINILGEPRLGFLVSSGNMDSMVNHYTAAKKRRNQDSYTPGGIIGKRPDRAAIVYCSLIRQSWREKPLIVGGIEASLRRLAHYDYWSGKMRRSLLMDSGADLISYGMGEHSIVEIADALNAGIRIQDITFIAGTCYRTREEKVPSDAVRLPSYEQLVQDPKNYAESFGIQYRNTDPFTAHTLAESYGSIWVVQNPPSMPLTMQEMDDVYDLPYCRKAHPSYDALGGVPAMSEVKFSLVSCRGCFGGCSFCALTFHQGRIIQARSHESILREAAEMTGDPDFKGYIHDVGGPTANFRAPACKKQEKHGVCRDRQCLFPKPCKNLIADHKDYISLLRKLRALPKVKKVFVRSGIRFDYVLADPSGEFLEELAAHHVSGQLKVAPEHVSDEVLELMGKPRRRVYDEFVRRYKACNEKLGMKQYLVPYLMSSHPGSTMKDAVELAEYLRELGYMPEQVQDFYPTPSTISTCMYYTGLDPRTMKKVYVPSDQHEKAMQRAVIQYRDPKNRKLVEEALRAAGREDLIGYGPKCLLRPENPHKEYSGKDRKRSSGVSENHSGHPSGSGRNAGTQKKNAGRKKTIRNIHKRKD